MPTWFECKIKYQITDEFGKTKNETENYLIDAVSFTEAEQRLHHVIQTNKGIDFSVAGIRFAKADEIIPSENLDALWFKAKITYFTIDERSGKEQKIGNIVFVAEENIFKALESLKKSLSSSMVEWSVDSISATKIQDVIPYELNLEHAENSISPNDTNDY
ncbi:MAG TPA: DUF4494 domain-containing protein [Salinivirgaceae bacterium]|nr:DUF4494 domain-containing protein [Salinivirgaceae bacterium]